MNSELRLSKKRIEFLSRQNILLPVSSKIVDFTFIDKTPYIIYLYECDREDVMEQVNLLMGKTMEHSSTFISADIEKMVYVNYSMRELTPYYLFIQN